MFFIVFYASLGETCRELGAPLEYLIRKRTITTLLHCVAKKGGRFLYQNLIMRCYVTILAEIYDNPTFFGSRPGFVNRTQSDPGFVNPVRSGPGFVNPIRSDPV